MQIRHISFDRGAHDYAQAELCEALGYVPGTKATRLFSNSGIARRQLVLDENEFDNLSRADFQHEVAKTRGFALMRAAASRALTGVDAADIGCLVVATSSGLHMPSMGCRLLAALDLDPATVKYDLVGVGCHAAPLALSLAQDYLKAHPGRQALVVCMELGSLDMLPADEHEGLGRTVVNSLFGDAASAVLVDDSFVPGSRFPEVVDVFHVQKPGSLKAVGLGVHDAGNRDLALSRQVPEYAVELVQAAHAYFQSVVAREDVTAVIQHWAIHPGGRAILDGIQDVFDLDDVTMDPSYQNLADHGNTGSVGCLLTLDHIVTEHQPARGDYGILVALGPGLSLAALLLRWP